MRTAIVLLLILLPVTLARAESRAAQEDAIREAVFRYMLPKKAPAPNDRYKVCFLEIANAAQQEQDPSDKIMKDLAGAPVRIAKYSKSRTLLGGEGIQIDPATKEFGTVLIVYKIAWYSQSKATVSAMYYYSKGGEDDYDYTLKKSGEDWKVVKHVLTGEV